MIKKKLMGFVIGITATIAGITFFTIIFSPESISNSLKSLFVQKKLGALISIGSLINIPLFFILLKLNKINQAYGLISFLLLLVFIVAVLKIV
ncbi:MAG: hypothetical protein ACJ0P5_06125 [Flavobacteriaceae bacterium]|tara:strand:- start:160 stop:438 length:279 start_codon:yes stop_codon:yes gene_type:complete